LKTQHRLAKNETRKNFLHCSEFQKGCREANYGFGGRNGVRRTSCHATPHHHYRQPPPTSVSTCKARIKQRRDSRMQLELTSRWDSLAWDSNSVFCFSF